MSKAQRPVRKDRKRKRSGVGHASARVDVDESVALADRRINTDQIVDVMASASSDDYSLRELTKEKAREVWMSLLGQFVSALCEGKSVVLRNLGTIEVYTKRPQRYRHPTTGEIGVSESKPFVRFRPSPVFLAQLQGT